MKTSKEQEEIIKKVIELESWLEGAVAHLEADWPDIELEGMVEESSNELEALLRENPWLYSKPTTEWKPLP